MIRMTVTLDEEMVAEAAQTLGTSTKAETIRMALSEILRRKRLQQALTNRGKIALDLDQETLREVREKG